MSNYKPLRFYDTKEEAVAMKQQLEAQGEKAYYFCVWYVYHQKKEQSR